MSSSLGASPGDEAGGAAATQRLRLRPGPCLLCPSPRWTRRPSPLAPLLGSPPSPATSPAPTSSAQSPTSLACDEPRSRASGVSRVSSRSEGQPGFLPAGDLLPPLAEPSCSPGGLGIRMWHASRRRSPRGSWDPDSSVPRLLPLCWWDGRSRTSRGDALCNKPPIVPNLEDGDRGRLETAGCVPAEDPTEVDPTEVDPNSAGDDSPLEERGELAGEWEGGGGEGVRHGLAPRLARSGRRAQRGRCAW